ncbi:MAG: type II toxin-antitoxin system prevent-host-death family antitoxin [Planctomycetes bacterium]|nr:type II toxin-antitoxin system prevent-host-death family antitoxin [Planctomycetota bacterium]
MESVGIFHAKTHLSELVERARKGEVIEITRHGKPVARLTASPPTPRKSAAEVDQVLAEIKRIRESPANHLTQDFVVQAIREAREARG